jgi:hypothetical protein
MIIYKAASDYNFVKSIVYRAICVAVMIYLFYNYEENPAVIIVAVIICLLFLFLIGSEDIIVHDDKVVISNTSIASVFTKHSTTYLVSDIESAELQPLGESSLGKLSMIALKMAFMRNNRRAMKSDNKFYLNLKNGEVITISSEYDRYTLGEVVEAINSVVY